MIEKLSRPFRRDNTKPMLRLLLLASKKTAQAGDFFLITDSVLTFA